MMAQAPFQFKALWIQTDPLPRAWLDGLKSQLELA